MTYSSPIPREDYEKIHSLRSSELTAAVAFLQMQPWFDGRFVIAGTSEGAVAVARYVPAPDAVREKGRIIFSWSCEDNYHVTTHRIAVPNNLPVLNIMSATDKSTSGSPERFQPSIGAFYDEFRIDIHGRPLHPPFLVNSALFNITSIMLNFI